ncbi:hypothetical protein [Burkholderia ambifaria]
MVRGNLERMRNFCVQPVDLAIFLTGSRNIIFRTDGERNPYARAPHPPTGRRAALFPEPFPPC